MPTVHSHTFRSGNSEAVHLPKDVAFGVGTEVVIVRSGDVMTIYPAKMTVPEMLARLNELPCPRAVEMRDDAEIPERPDQ